MSDNALSTTSVYWTKGIHIPLGPMGPARIQHLEDLSRVFIVKRHIVAAVWSPTWLLDGNVGDHLRCSTSTVSQTLAPSSDTDSGALA